jgi:hypothetical protein
MTEITIEKPSIYTTLITWGLIISLTAGGLFVLSTFPIPPPNTTKIPLGCGETAINRSESYVIHNMCGLAPCPLTLYHLDLVCSNGTTFLKWRTTSSV